MISYSQTPLELDLLQWSNQNKSGIPFGVICLLSMYVLTVLIGVVWWIVMLHVEYKRSYNNIKTMLTEYNDTRKYLQQPRNNITPSESVKVTPPTESDKVTSPPESDKDK